MAFYFEIRRCLISNETTQELVEWQPLNTNHSMADPANFDLCFVSEWHASVDRETEQLNRIEKSKSKK